MILLAIDPGPEKSGWVEIDTDTRLPVGKGNERPNEEVRDRLDMVELLAVEMIASYGMAVGADTFQTCVEIGRFVQAWSSWSCFSPRPAPALITRPDVKLHLCHARNAGDPNIRQRLIDIYGPGKDKAIGLKASPGPLYGVSGHSWQALGLAVCALETVFADQIAKEAA